MSECGSDSVVDDIPVENSNAESASDSQVSQNSSSSQKTQGSSKEKKEKAVNLLTLFRFATPSDYTYLLIGLSLCIINGLAVPTLWVIFGFALDNFANHQISFDYFYCINQFTINCSNVFYCSAITNQTRCCFDDSSYECIETDQFLQNMDYLTIFIIVCGFAVFFFGTGHSIFYRYVGSRQVLEIRKKLFSSIIQQDMEWFDSIATEEITSRMTEKLDKVGSGLGESLSVTFQTMVTFFALNALSFYYDWRMGLFYLGSWPASIMGGVFLQKLTELQGVKEDDKDEKVSDYGTAGAIAEEVLSAIHTVTSYGGQASIVEKYGEALDAFRKRQHKKFLTYAISFAISFFFFYLYFSFTYWFGGFLIQNYNAEFSKLVMAGLTYYIAVLLMVGNQADMDNVGAATEAAKEIFDIIDKVPTININSDMGIIPEEISYDIKLSEVTFSYPSRPDITVLDGLDLNIQSGQTVALVGASGSGKSTIIQLLQRFYDINSGEILIGGHDVRELNLQWLRQSIGVVSQEPVMFGGTIAENISYGKEDATQEEIEKAAKAANAHLFITELPDGYDTLVGERGTQLSGGQKQRVAIARALIRDPKILLLDEATSALDTESEAIVQNALNKASMGRTTIVIAHRLSTIKQVNCIAVVDKGKIMEIGTQQELLALQGMFFKLIAAQLYSQTNRGDEVVKTKIPADDYFAAKHLSFSDLDSDGDDDDEHEENKEMLHIVTMSQRLYLCLAIISSILEGTLFCIDTYLFVAIPLKAYLDSSTAEKNSRLALIVIPLFGMLMGITMFTRVYCYGNNGAILISRLRTSSLKAMLRQEIGWFDLKYNWTGALVSRLSVDTSLIENLVGTQLGMMIAVTADFVVVAILTFIYLDPSAASLIMTALLPLATVPIIVKTMLSVKTFNNVKLAIEESNHVMFESIVHIHTVKSFSLQKTLIQIFANHLTSKNSEIGKLHITLGIVYGTNEVCQFAIAGIMVRFGAFLVSVPNEHKFHATLVNILVPTLTILTAALIARTLNHSLSNYFKAKTSVKSIFSLLYRIPTINSSSIWGVIPDHTNGVITFDRVAFAYPTRNEAPVFKSVSFSVLPGQTLAIVGPSGCGKSTVTALIERFYDPSSGVVRLDGTDIRMLNIQWLRSQIGLVSQEPVLFHASIADNIRYGANFREVTDEEVQEAAKCANVHDFIMGLPQGYETKVGPKGSQLSGGQKQRVAIARALVRDPKILLLDEATSALDTESEKCS
ncbi:ATP-dependent translocase ABCB1-like isoform X2 [Dysidea avara]|uniref:ATP-dependent translocase ABCB1-like isoform X2 n=1 Tax=Dysidea avara TaxID=196820 RepID=UPI00331797F3